MEIRPREVHNYMTPDERVPFREWLVSLKDKKTRAIIEKRIERLHRGDFGDAKKLNGDLYELRIHYGAGYRAYLGDLAGILVILLCGGTKRTQKRHIQKAKDYWEEFKRRNVNRDFILKNTTSFKDDLLEDLKDPEFAQHYLEAALEDYEKDGDTESLLLAMRDVAQAQGGIGQLAKKTQVTREHLYDILASKHQPRLDNLLSILSGLGLRVRLERQESPTGQTVLRETMHPEIKNVPVMKGADMKTYAFKVVVEPDEDRWFAYCPTLEKYGAATWGYTKEEALKHIREVVEMVVEELIEDGELIPESPQEEVTVFPESRVAVTI